MEVGGVRGAVETRGRCPSTRLVELVIHALLWAQHGARAEPRRGRLRVRRPQRRKVLRAEARGERGCITRAEAVPNDAPIGVGENEAEVRLKRKIGTYPSLAERTWVAHIQMRRVSTLVSGLEAELESRVAVL